MTTHLLSRRVTVSGYIQDVEEPISKFSVNLDRSSGLQGEIIASIENSCNQLETNSYQIDESIDENSYNTCFTYFLDQHGINVAKEGINNLIISAPFVFAFVPEINTITIIEGGVTKKIERRVERPIKLENSKVISTSITTNGKKENRYIALLQNNESGVEIAVEVEQKQGGNWLSAIAENLPKLYCDFPLLGTNDFAFPVVINCRSFNPTEPRNGIFLTTREDKEDSDYVKVNKTAILVAVELYEQFLSYFTSEHYNGIYNIVKLNAQPQKEWISIEWMERDVIIPIKKFISNVPLVKTASDDYCSLNDAEGNDGLLIPAHQNEKARMQLLNLALGIFPNRMPQKAELNNWYNSLWEDCHNFKIEDLIETVEKLGSVAVLKQYVGEDWFSWLKEFYSLIYNRDYGVAQGFLDKCIIPNLNGDFCAIDNLKINEDIDEEYYKIAQLIGIDLKSQIVDNNVARLNQIYHQSNLYNFDALCNDFRRQLRVCTVTHDEFYRCIIRLSANSKYDEFVGLMEDFYKGDWSVIFVNTTSDELSNVALEYWIDKSLEDISDLKTLQKLSKHFGFESNDYALNWLNRFFYCLHKLNKLSLINNKDVCPTQNDNFRCITELYLDSGEIAEETKDVLHWFYNDADIAANMQKIEEYDSVLSKYGVNDIQQLESILSKSKTDNVSKIEITSELLTQWGITSEEELNKALQNNLLGENFIYTPTKDKEKFNYVQSILQRSKDNVMNYLGSLEEYDVSDPMEIEKTVFLVRKNDEEIYIIPRPSDYNQVVIYYNSELDMLDYEKDCELWVENGIDITIKLTFGKILNSIFG